MSILTMLRGKSLRSRQSQYRHSQLPGSVSHQPCPQLSGHRHQAQHVLPGQVRPHYNPNKAHPNEVREMADESVYKDRVCTLCSDKEHEVCHHHVSSESVRVFAQRHTRRYLYNGPNPARSVATMHCLFVVFGVCCMWCISYFHLL